MQGEVVALGKGNDVKIAELGFTLVITGPEGSTAELGKIVPDGYHELAMAELGIPEGNEELKLQELGTAVPEENGGIKVAELETAVLEGYQDDAIAELGTTMLSEG